MLVNHPRHDGQSNACAFKVFSTVQTLKHSEQFVHILHVETNAVITNEDGQLIVDLNLPHFNQGFVARSGVFDGVGEQIGEHLPHQTGITRHGRQIAYSPFDLSALRLQHDSGHRFIDVLIHGWDVAKATGQDTTLPNDLVQACIEVVRPQEELLAGSGAFSTDVQAPSGADAQTQLLAMLGRRA